MTGITFGCSIFAKMTNDPIRDEIHRRDWSWVGEALEFGLEAGLELIGGIFELLSGL